MQDSLEEVLADHQSVGVLGRALSVGELIAQSEGFLQALGDVPTGSTVLDVGSGGGVPALPMLVARPDLRFVLVERRSSRAGLLRGAVRRLGVEDRAVVVEVDVRRLPAEWRDQRFGTARCAGSESELLRMVRPLMAPGGLLVLSVRAGSAAVDVPGWDPPEAITVDRWTYRRWSAA